MMGFLRVYGEKNGTEKLLFATLDENCKKTAKKTATQHGYKITKVIKIGNFQNGFKEENITNQW